MDRIPPKRIPLRPDGAPMSAEEIRELRDRIAAFGDFTWIDDDTREIVEMFMSDLVSRLPAKRDRDVRAGVRPDASQGEAEGHREGSAEA